MAKTERTSRKIVSKSQSHIPKNSVFYEKVVPALLVGMAVLMVLLILLAAGILLGFVQF